MDPRRQGYYPQFFYPTPESDVIHTPPPDSRPYDTRDARVTLAEIPFVRVREGLPQRLIEGAARFSATVEAAQRALAPARLNVDLNRGSIHAGGEIIALPPASLAFYVMLARRRVEGLDGVRWTDDGLDRAYLAWVSLRNPRGWRSTRVSACFMSRCTVRDARKLAGFGIRTSMQPTPCSPTSRSRIENR